MRHFIFLFLCLTALFASTSVSVATEQGMGPEDIILQSTIDPADPNNPRLAFFLHALHQEKYYCSTCHHTTDKDGKKILYEDGMKVEKCESCNNRSAIYTGMPERYTPFKEVAHLRCKGCHRQLKKEGQPAGPITCKGCHRKDLNK